MLKEKGYPIYRSFLGMALTFAIILWINEYFALKVHVAVCILYAFIFAVLIYLFDRSKNNLIKIIALISLLPLSGLLFLILKVNPYLWIKEIIMWCISYDHTEELYKLMPAYTVLAAVTLAVSILLYLLIKNFISRLLLAAAILTVFIVFSILKINLGKVDVGIGIFFLLSILIEISGMLYSRKTGIKDKRESILYLLPVCLLLTVISIGLPSKPEPIQWSGVKNFYYSVKDQIEKLITQWEFFTAKGEGIFSISLSGYSEDGSLDNDDLKSSNKIALIVKGRRGLSPLYLIGSVNDTYTGYSWEKSKESMLPGEEEYQLDYAELIYGLSRLDSSIFEECRLIETASVEILYHNIKTKSFFYPSKMKWVKLNNSDYKYNTENAGITFHKALGDKVSYELSYYELNLQEPKFQEFLREADSFSYEKSRDINYDRIDTLKTELRVRDKDKLVLNREDLHELFKTRAGTIQARFTQLPDNLPERVKELAKSITKDLDNNYDKLKAIESFLHQYSYSYTPGMVPEDEDFVDYFLFENKKGYCTSFATSMAVLGRCIGIPTRYVEGYLVDYKDRTDGGFNVRNSNAHAWIEAYFEGVGWIPFEPTPGFRDIRYMTWPPLRHSENTRNSSYYNFTPEEMYSTETAIKSEKEISLDNEKSEKVVLWLLATVAVLLILLCAVVSYYFILHFKYWNMFKKADFSMKTYMIFVRILTLLKYEGYTMGSQETILMLSDKVKNRYMYQDIKFKDVADIYMSYRYGEIPVTIKDFERVNIFYTGLKEQHNSERKKLKQFIEEFLFLIRMNNYKFTD